MILGLWIAAFTGAFPVFFIVVINRLELPSGEAWNYSHPDWYGNVTLNNRTIVDAEFCALDIENAEASQTFIICAFLLFFLFPGRLMPSIQLQMCFSYCDYGSLSTYPLQDPSNGQMSWCRAAKQDKESKESDSNASYCCRDILHLLDTLPRSTLNFYLFPRS